MRYIREFNSAMPWLVKVAALISMTAFFMGLNAQASLGIGPLSMFTYQGVWGPKEKDFPT